MQHSLQRGATTYCKHYGINAVKASKCRLYASLAWSETRSHDQLDVSQCRCKMLLKMIKPASFLVWFLSSTSSINFIYYTHNRSAMATMKSTAFQLCALIITLLSITIGSVTADATFTPILPPSYPLAVRSPYLSGMLLSQLIASLNLQSRSNSFFIPTTY